MTDDPIEQAWRPEVKALRAQNVGLLADLAGVATERDEARAEIKQLEGDLERLKVELSEERQAFLAEQVAGQEAREQIAELSTALEQTVSVLHHEAHSVYTDWRVCDDARCRRAAGLV